MNDIVLVTGGTGTIGTAIIEELLKLGYKDIRCLSNDENGEYESRLHFKGNNAIRYVNRDIRDYWGMKSALEDVTIVFHCAAHKHVSLCNYNFFEAVDVNINGTMNLLKCVLELNSCKKFINISTDKACYPVGLMGGTKFVAEKMVNRCNYFKKKAKQITKFASVRFGNVLNSRGSLLDIWSKIDIIPVAENMKRFFMKIEDAVKLIFLALETLDHGDTFILKMPVIRISDLAEVYAKKYNKTTVSYFPNEDERTYEFLMSAEESLHRYETTEIFIISEDHQNDIPLIYSTETIKEIKKEEIEKILDDINDKPRI